MPVASDGVGASAPTLRRIIPTSHMIMPEHLVKENINKCFDRNLPRLWDSGLLFTFRGDQPIAIVGGGPSLNSTVQEMKGMTVMVCGSAHDHLISLGIKPDYCVLVDPEDLMAKYISAPDPDCTYLVASQCSPLVFDRLKDNKVLVWHCGGFKDDDEAYRKEPRIGGGCTVTLRGLTLAIVLGYGNHHYFGFDSCFMGEKHHSYDSEDIPDVIDIHLDGSDRVFMVAPYMLAQAAQFQDSLKYHGNLFTPTIHGNGLIAEIMKIGHTKAKEMNHV